MNEFQAKVLITWTINFPLVTSSWYTKKSVKEFFWKNGKQYIGQYSWGYCKKYDTIDIRKENKCNDPCFFYQVWSSIFAFIYNILVSHTMPVISIINSTEYVNIFLNIERFNIKTDYVKQFNSQRKEEKLNNFCNNIYLSYVYYFSWKNGILCSKKKLLVNI